MPRFHHDLLRTLRLDLGLTQEQAAAAARVDVRTWRRYESGRVNEGGFEVRSAARRQFIRRLCEEFGVADESAWLLPDAAADTPPAPAPATLAGHWAPRIVHPLQPAVHFLGRDEPLAALAAWHADGATPTRVVVVQGVGGAGKTALVERFLRQLAPSASAGVYVWSCYDDPRIASLVSGARRYFAPDDALAPSEDLPRLLEALGSGAAHLLVVDGLEVVQSEGGEGRAFGEVEDPTLRQLLRALAAGVGRSRLLVTSRMPLADIAAWDQRSVRSVALGDLGATEARALLRAWGLRDDDDALDALAERVGCHALSVAMVGSYAGAFLAGDPGAARALPVAEWRRDDPLARRLGAVLDAYARALAPLERDLLARLAVFANGIDVRVLVALAAAPAEVAGALAGQDEAALRHAVARLARLGLLYRGGGDRVAAHPFVREHFRSRLGVPADALHAVARDVAVDALGGRPVGRVASPDVLDRIEALLEHTLHAGQTSAAFDVYQHGLGGFDWLGLHLGAMSRGARVLRLFAPGRTPESLHSGLGAARRAQAAYEWGLFAAALGDLALARRCYRAHLDALRRDVAPPNAHHAAGLRALAYTDWLAGVLEGAARYAAAALAAARVGESHFHEVRAHLLCAAVAHERGDVAATTAHLAQADALEPAPVARRALWKAEILLARGSRDAARSLARASLEFSLKRDWPGHAAHAHALLGAVALPADPARARTELREAQRWTGRSGEVEMRLRCHELAARTALAEGDLVAARGEVEAGSALAASLGFGLAALRLAVTGAEVARAAGAASAAFESSADAVQRAAEGGYAWALADALHVHGVAAAALGLEAEARVALERALTLRTDLGHPGIADTRAALQGPRGRP